MEKKKILITDDEANILKVVRARLEAMNYEVFTAVDAEDAMVKIDKVKPDLILLDVMLPGKNGLAFCKELKEREASKHIPVILFSARPQAEDAEPDCGVGADAYILKPFNPQHLAETIQKILVSAESR